MRIIAKRTLRTFWESDPRAEQPLKAWYAIAAIEHVMEARGLRQKDFAALIGSQPRASEVLNRHRPLTRKISIMLGSCFQAQNPAA